MKIGFAFYGIAHGTDKKTGYTRDFRHCWPNINRMLIQPFINKGHEAVIFASTYKIEDPQVDTEFYNTLKPKVVVYSDFETSDAFTSKGRLHDAFADEKDLDLIIFTRTDIHFSQVIADLPIAYDKFNFLFPEGDGWWDRARFACDCFYIWPHKYSKEVCDSMRETYGWPRGTQYPDTHGLINFLAKRIQLTQMHMISGKPAISNVNEFYTLCRRDVPDHPCFHPEVRERFKNG